MFSAASPSGFSSASSAFSSASSASQSVGALCRADAEKLLGYARGAPPEANREGSLKLFGCVGRAFSPPASRASRVRSVHWIASAFSSRISSFAGVTLHSLRSGATSPKRRSESSYDGGGSEDDGEEEDARTVARIASGRRSNSTASGSTPLANTSIVTCVCDWYHWCLYAGAAGRGGAGAEEAPDAEEEGATRASSASSHLAIHESSCFDMGSSARPRSNAVRASAGRSRAWSAMPRRRCALALSGSRATARSASSSASAGRSSLSRVAERWIQALARVGAASTSLVYSSNAEAKSSSTNASIASDASAESGAEDAIASAAKDVTRGETVEECRRITRRTRLKNATRRPGERRTIRGRDPRARAWPGGQGECSRDVPPAGANFTACRKRRPREKQQRVRATGWGGAARAG